MKVHDRSIPSRKESNSRTRAWYIQMEGGHLKTSIYQQRSVTFLHSSVLQDLEETSLAYLIPRFHKATEGEFRLDGINVNEINLEVLRAQVTYVFQETQLFSRSIVENIKYGNPGAPLEEVIRVAEIAGVHDFISTLPDGYETKLGTTSAKLSVGQKQRIAIARGLLRDSKILILDEPTSALDPETEEYLVSFLGRSRKRSTGDNHCA